MSRIRLGSELLSEQESNYIREVAGKAGLTVKEYIKESGGSQKILAFLQKRINHEDSWTNYKPVLNKYEKQGLKFKIDNEIVSKAVIDNYINQIYNQYHDEIYTHNRLIHIDFIVNYRDMTVSIGEIELFAKTEDEKGNIVTDYNVSDTIYEGEESEFEESEGEEQEVIERRGKYTPVKRDNKGRFTK